MARATFGAGCFWGVQAAFDMVRGVVQTTVGYGGGHKEDPTYEEVCSKTTGHVELIDIEYDSALVSFEELLKVFFQIHDPTQVNRQGPDVGEQYRSVIFYHSEEQKVLAEKTIAQMKDEGTDVATLVEAFINYYPAEDYHQKYLQKRKSLS